MFSGGTGGYSVPKGQDVMISVYNIHRSPAVWDDPDAFIPERFGPLEGPVPTEQNTDYRYIPFSGGPRCGHVQLERNHGHVSERHC